jgi:hypothetical protein
MSPFVFKGEDGGRVWQEGGNPGASRWTRENVMIVPGPASHAAAVGPYQLIFGRFVPLLPL